VPTAQVFDRYARVRFPEKPDDLRLGESLLHRPTLSLGRTLNLNATQTWGDVACPNVRSERSYVTEGERQASVDGTVARFPALRGRLFMMHVPGDDKASFRNPATRDMLHQQVQSILGSSIRRTGERAP
jgi:hypothetical protein